MAEYSHNNNNKKSFNHGSAIESLSVHGIPYRQHERVLEESIRTRLQQEMFEDKYNKEKSDFVTKELLKILLTAIGVCVLVIASFIIGSLYERVGDLENKNKILELVINEDLPEMRDTLKVINSILSEARVQYE